MPHRKNIIKKAQSIVVKIGTSLLTDQKGKLDTKNLRQLVEDLAALHKQGKKIVIVTSGAIITGSERIGIKGRVKSIPEKQAAAAVGQSLLMKEYEKLFTEFGITVAQILLTRDEIADRERYLNARNALTALVFEYNVIPIINENDTVSVDEIKIGDNDTLSALVASVVGADLLILLTDVEGFFMDDKVVDEIAGITPAVESAAGGSSIFGTGGMVTKIQAAHIAANAGVPMVIAFGRGEKVIESILLGEKVGTLFLPKETKLEPRKRWIAHGLKVIGKLVIDDGAAEALVKKGSSLLAVGIEEVMGKFKPGDLVSLTDGNGKELGRGLVNFSSDELNKIKKLKMDKIPAVLGYQGADEVINRDNLVIL